jgi:hypothetical protein
MKMPTIKAAATSRATPAITRRPYSSLGSATDHITGPSSASAPQERLPPRRGAPRRAAPRSDRSWNVQPSLADVTTIGGPIAPRVVVRATPEGTRGPRSNRGTRRCRASQRRGRCRTRAGSPLCLGDPSYPPAGRPIGTVMRKDPGLTSCACGHERLPWKRSMPSAPRLLRDRPGSPTRRRRGAFSAGGSSPSTTSAH